MSNYGHPTTLSVTNGVLSDTLTWHAGNARWEGSSLYMHEHYLNPNTRAWRIKNESTNAVLSETPTFAYSQIASNSPTSLTWSNSWVVSEASAGAQGDPHIKPLFGKDYTI